MHRDKFTCTDAYGRTFGNLVHPFLVKPQLAKIFACREKMVREMFG